jgi:hypothetical protein
MRDSMTRQGGVLASRRLAGRGILWVLLAPACWPSQDDIIIYKPPQRGAPGGRESWTRGFREALPTLAVLA